jgi:ubiquinone/menaquinone biosynthesis C-methylase UbiE
MNISKHSPALNRPMIAKGDPFGRPAQAEGYSAFRPNYPDALMAGVEVILRAQGCMDSRAKDGSMLVDICTGSGQVLRKLARYFEHAKGVDQSAAQLTNATKGSNVEYLQADALSVPLPDGSASVVTCAQAMHWLDIPTFLRGVDRLLRPEGVLVVLGYPRSHIPKMPQADAAMIEWYASLDDVWDCDRALLDMEFAGTDYTPFVQFSKQKVEETHMMSVEHLVGYLDTWSSFRTWKENHPDVNPDTLQVLSARLQAALAAEGEGRTLLPVEFSFFAIFLRRPGDGRASK